MKTFVLSGLYVFSIVLAIGIGMVQMVRETPTFGGDVPKCTAFVDQKTCQGNSPACSNSPRFLDETHLMRVRNAIDVVRVAGAPADYQCYFAGLPCDLEQRITYKHSCVLVLPSSNK